MSDAARVQVAGELDRRIADMIIRRGDCLKVAEHIKSNAEYIAPRSDIAHAHYADSFAVESTKGGARVVNRSRIASIVEFGAPGQNIPGQFVMHASALAAGYKFRKRH